MVDCACLVLGSRRPAAASPKRTKAA